MIGISCLLAGSVGIDVTRRAANIPTTNIATRPRIHLANLSCLPPNLYATIANVHVGEHQPFAEGLETWNGTETEVVIQASLGTRLDQNQ